MISLLTMEKIAKKSGVRRISKDALEEMRECIEELGLEIARDAWQIAEHAGRRTVKQKDITFAIERRRR